MWVTQDVTATWNTTVTCQALISSLRKSYTWSDELLLLQSSPFINFPTLVWFYLHLCTYIQAFSIVKNDDKSYEEVELPIYTYVIIFWVYFVIALARLCLNPQNELVIEMYIPTTNTSFRHIGMYWKASENKASKTILPKFQYIHTYIHTYTHIVCKQSRDRCYDL
jgi:hypothetical protein